MGRKRTYLEGLSRTDTHDLSRANEAGFESLRAHLAHGTAVAFLGAGASAPLYPPWQDLISELVDRAADHIDGRQAQTLRAIAASSPDAVVQIVRDGLTEASYRSVLHELFRPRHDPETSRSWTPLQEMIARCNFRGIVTTNYDHGIVAAASLVRPFGTSVAHVTYTNADALDRWRTGDILSAQDSFSILFAHGHYIEPETIVLATGDYRTAYAGKLTPVLISLLDREHLVWLGFSFSDRHVSALLQEVSRLSGPLFAPNQLPRHIAILPWRAKDRDRNDPSVLRARAAIEFGSELVLYPQFDDDHSALLRLLEEAADPVLPPIRSLGQTQTRPTERSSEIAWIHGGEAIPSFVGREEELARLHRWAGDGEVRLIGVTAWGGAGKTALVTEWLTNADGIGARKAARGLFAWSFYEVNSAEGWARALLRWARETFDWQRGSAEPGIEASEARGQATPAAGVYGPETRQQWAERLAAMTDLPASAETGQAEVARGEVSDRVRALLEDVPLILVLDGLEVLQAGPASSGFGGLLDGPLRAILVSLCRAKHQGLVVLTSRFPFSDLERFDGGAARFLEVPPFTPSEGAVLLEERGGEWLSEADRMDLTRSVHGHALAVDVVAGLLRPRTSDSDVDALRSQLERLAHTDARVSRVLAFYAERLSAEDRFLVGLVSLYQRPVLATTLLTLGGHERFGARLGQWSLSDVEHAARRRLSGLLTWHSGPRVSAHPLVRDAFRPLVLTGETAQLTADVALASLPGGMSTDNADAALLVTELIELLLDADDWEAADRLFTERLGDGDVFFDLPAANLGQRTAAAFVSESRQATCAQRLPARSRWYLNDLGAFSVQRGDLSTAERAFQASVAMLPHRSGPLSKSFTLRQLAQIRSHRGQAGQALELATEAANLAQTVSRQASMISRAMLAWMSHEAGETLAADRLFISAGLGRVSAGLKGDQLLAAERWWAEFLRLTGRKKTARSIIELNRKTAHENGQVLWAAGAEMILAKLWLEDGELEHAGRALARAASTYLESDNLLYWSEMLPVQSEHRRRSGLLEEAIGLANEALDVAEPRGLVPIQISALAVRARARADQVKITGTVDCLERARDDADSALRLALAGRQLPWSELEAMVAHRCIDEVEGANHGWLPRVNELHARLVPAELEVDPISSAKFAF